MPRHPIRGPRPEDLRPIALRKQPEYRLIKDLVEHSNVAEAIRLVGSCEHLAEWVCELGLNRARYDMKRNLTGYHGLAEALALCACCEAEDGDLVEEVAARVTRALADVCIRVRRYETKEG